MASGSFLRAIFDLLFPPRCVFCGGILGDSGVTVCLKCKNTLPRATGTHVDGVIFCSGCAVPFLYSGTVRSAILRFKFGGRKNYAAGFGKLLSRCIEERLSGKFDLISWVPVSNRRLRERGYDQAKLLAQAAAKELGFPFESTLRKIKHNPAQSGIHGAASRRANVKSVYAPAQPFAAKGLRVLLVDDIITTGATISEAARTLVAAGAEAVCAAALARVK